MGNIREFLHYDPNTGVFTWQKRRGKSSCMPGTVAGRIALNGYRTIKFEQRTYRAARLAWWFVHGAMPNQYIDHINGQRDDNRICNLRLATPKENARNRRSQTGSSSQYKGVTLLRSTGKWMADIWNGERKVYLGVFEDERDAAKAYDAAARTLHHDFARLNFA